MDERERNIWDEEDRIRRVRLLEAGGMSQAAKRPLNVTDLAEELAVSSSIIRQDLEELSALGRILDGLEQGLPPILLHAGRQFIAGRPTARREVLRFLPHVIDDLNAREALLLAGTILVDEFRAAFLDGDPVEHAREMVPRAFAPAVDERVALDLYAAAVALMARLSDGAPAGCLAEEIVAVDLMDEARTWLELRREEGLLEASEEEAAGDELRGLFELFEDDDVLDMFAMHEPADAAMAGHDPVNDYLGVVDQRLEAWFDPYGWAAPTGYLQDPLRPDEPATRTRMRNRCGMTATRNAEYRRPRPGSALPEHRVSARLEPLDHALGRVRRRLPGA